MQAWVVYRMERRTSIQVNNFVILLLGIWKYGEASGQYTTFPELKAFQPYIQTECYAFSPVVWTGTHHPITHKRVCPPFDAGGGTHSLARGGLGGPNSDEGTDHRIHIYLKYDSICFLVRIGIPHSPSLACECVPPPPEPKGGHTRLRVRGPIRTTGEKA